VSGQTRTVDLLTAAPAATRPYASRRRLRPPAAERLSAHCAGPPTAKRLRADADKRPKKSLIAEWVGRTRAAERCGRSQTANGRSQRGRGNPSNQSLFDTDSCLCVAIERLSNWRSGFSVGINALERWLDASEAGAAERPSADGAGPPTAKRLRAGAYERPEGRINALERGLDASEAGLDDSA
jgi:hypothetical protein